MRENDSRRQKAMNELGKFGAAEGWSCGTRVDRLARHAGLPPYAVLRVRALAVRALCAHAERERSLFGRLGALPLSNVISSTVLLRSSVDGGNFFHSVERKVSHGSLVWVLPTSRPTRSHRTCGMRPPQVWPPNAAVRGLQNSAVTTR